MSKEEINAVDGNELISEFMDAKDSGNGWVVIPHRGWGYQRRHYPKTLKYHKSWDWLMPVVEKISNTVIKGYPPMNSDELVKVEIITSSYVRISNLRDTPIFANVSIEGSNIMAVWKAVVQFIKWYNQQKQTS